MKIKALSFRQPWAELVLQGKKSLDLRTWSTRYRGVLGIFASQTIEKEPCLAFGLDPDQLTAGAVIGLVDLTSIVELDEQSYAQRTGEHLGGRSYQSPLYGWELTNPRPIAQPIPARGRQLLFEVELPEQEELQEAPQPPSARLSSGEQILSWESKPAFELRLTPQPDPLTRQPSYRLSLYQRSLQPPPIQPGLYQATPDQMQRVVDLHGAALHAIADRVLEALRQNGYKATDLSPNRREPFSLQEESGVRLALLFMAVKPVSKVNRIEMISAGIQNMTSEELYYWYSKCSHRSAGEQAQKALRILLSND